MICGKDVAYEHYNKKDGDLYSFGDEYGDRNCWEFAGNEDEACPYHS